MISYLCPKNVASHALKLLIILVLASPCLVELGLLQSVWGRRAVYDRVDLDEWLDDYKSRGRAIKEELWPEKKDSTDEKTRRIGGSRLSSQTDARYAEVLGLKS